MSLIHEDDQEVEDHTCEPANEYHVYDVAKYLEQVLNEYELEDLDVIALKSLAAIFVSILLLVPHSDVKYCFEKLVIVLVLKHAQEQPDSEDFEKHKASQPSS